MADAEAVRLIAVAEAQSIFQAFPSDESARVQHRASGLVCSFTPGENNSLQIFPTFARGEDVACNSEGAQAVRTIYATRYPAPTTLEDQLSGAVAAIQARLPDVAPAPRELLSEVRMSGVELPVSRSERFVFDSQSGVRRYTRVSVAMLDGWVIKLRYTGDAPDDAALALQDELASALWARTLGQMAAMRQL